MPPRQASASQSCASSTAASVSDGVHRDASGSLQGLVSGPEAQQAIGKARMMITDMGCARSPCKKPVQDYAGAAVASPESKRTSAGMPYCAEERFVLNVLLCGGGEGGGRHKIANSCLVNAVAKARNHIFHGC